MPYFTRLIDDYDRGSIKSSSLILSNQVISPPGSDVLFQFDKHTTPITHTYFGFDEKLILTLSKLCIFSLAIVDLIGEIEFGDDEKSPFCFFLPYLDMATTIKTHVRDMGGGFLLATCDELKSYAYDSTLRCSLKFTSRKIIDLVLVNFSSIPFNF